MATLDKNPPPSSQELQDFQRDVNFHLPQGFISFYEVSNGATIQGNESYAELWTLSSMIESNLDYDVDTYAPEFFLFGSDGGGNAFAIERNTGHLYEMPFIGMSKEEAVFRSASFSDFLNGFK